jgi:hypothetical protein
LKAQAAELQEVEIGRYLVAAVVAVLLAEFVEELGEGVEVVDLHADGHAEGVGCVSHYLVRC